jgi:hypothetical protein
MSSDPSMNVVVFTIQRQGKQENIVNEVSTQALDGFKTAWGKAQQSHGARAEEVREIYSEWQPSEQDIVFIDEHFPNAKVSYSFDRPTDGNWEQAFARVQRIIEDALEKDGASQGPILLPILRNEDSLTQVMVHEPMGAAMVVCLAYVKRDKDGHFHLEYVTKAKIQNSAERAQALWHDALSALVQGLEVRVGDYHGEQMFMIKGQRGFAAAILALPDFLTNATKWTQSQRITVAILDPDTLVVCDANLAIADHLREMVLNSPYAGPIDLTPCLLLFEQGSVFLKERRSNP